ncbi:MAG: beta-CASP ribonuclease aCPSF1 [Candidatus Micrarchaeia archaeon]
MEIEEVEEIVERIVGSFKKVEFEGSDIVIYVDDPNLIYSNEAILKQLATTLKKKIIARSTNLKKEEEAKKEILRILPKEAGIKSINFLPKFREVYIEALKPGLVIGKKGNNLRVIIKATGWIPRTLRVPTINSETITLTRSLFFKTEKKRKRFLNEVGKKINKKVLEKSENVKAIALGGFRQVGRSSLLVQTKNSKVLIDCGISPEPGVLGVEEAEKAFPYLNSLGFPLEDIDAIVVSHAHMDHIGFIPYLFSYGYKGPVYSTPPTKELAALLLLDYINIVEKSGHKPPYSSKDVKKMLSNFITRDYGEVTDITNEIRLTFHNAGHILGSAMVHLHIGEGLYNLLYTGDIKYGFSRLFDVAETHFPRVDSLFIESTYGGKQDIMPKRYEAESRLMKMIKQTIENGGSVLIPLFSVGRSQEIMLVIDEYLRNKEYYFNAPVYLDGMILEASAIHTVYPEYLKEGIQRKVLNNQSPFENPIFEIVKKDKKEIVESGGSVILASGGMLNGGTSLEYLKLMCDNPKNLLIFVGYNSPTSLGRKLQSGIREIALLDDEGKLKKYQIKMQIETIEGFSGHSDRVQLLNFVQNLQPRPKKIFVMHGEEEKSLQLAQAIRNVTKTQTFVPNNLDVLQLC